MIALYANGLNYDENYFDETLMFYMLYLFTFNARYSCYLSMIANNLRLQDKWTERFYCWRYTE